MSRGAFNDALLKLHGQPQQQQPAHTPGTNIEVNPPSSELSFDVIPAPGPSPSPLLGDFLGTSTPARNWRFSPPTRSFSRLIFRAEYFLAKPFLGNRAELPGIRVFYDLGIPEG